LGLVLAYIFGPSLLVLVPGWGAGLFFLGKKNSLRSDTFFLAENNPAPHPSDY